MFSEGIAFVIHGKQDIGKLRSEGRMRVPVVPIGTFLQIAGPDFLSQSSSTIPPTVDGVADIAGRILASGRISPYAGSLT